MTDTQTVNGTTNAAWAYAYDTAGRLTSATLAAAGARPSVTDAYSYTSTGGCGADTAAGMDSARASTTLTLGAGTPATTTDCTDYASRLTSATGANPLTSVTYNTHGDATTLGAQTITYDALDRVTGISSSTGGATQTVTYALDPQDRLVTRTATGSGTGSENSTTTYAYTSAGDTADFQLGTSNTLAERYLPLPGGALLTRRYTTTGGDIWSIPDLHGDITATTGPTGTLYDPYGTPLDPTTGATNPTATPTTRTNGLTDAWEGAHQRAYEHTGGLNDTLMGAPLYLPTYGQFTSTDPIPGGNPNPYMYPDDPINNEDLTGQWSWRKFTHRLTSIAKFGANLANGSTVLGLAIAYGTGNHCGYNMQFVCTGGSYPFGGGSSFGNTFVAAKGVKRNQITQSLLDHEAGHSNQWAIGGWVFAGLYLADEALDYSTALSGGCNVFERNAGLGQGGYSGCHETW